MKKILLGISLILFGIACMLFAWLSEIAIMFIVGFIFAILGLCSSIIGFSKDE